MAKQEFWEDLTIEKVLIILEKNPFFNFERFIFLKDFKEKINNWSDFLDIYFEKLIDKDYTTPWLINYLWNDDNFKAFFNNEEDLNIFLDKLLDIQISNVVRWWEKELVNFLKDPAIKNIKEILKQKDLLSINIETKIILVRNLYFKNKEVNSENIRIEYKEYLKNKEKYSKIRLFKWRNVIFTAHHEDLDKEYQTKNNKERFWRKTVINAIENQWWKVNIINPENNIEDLRNAKKDTLNALIKTSSPMTFVFNWHWWPDWIYLSDWDYIDWNKQSVKEQNDTIKISVDDIANALIERSKNNELWNVEKDILIFESCYNHTFIRKLYNNLNNNNKKIKESCSNENIVYLPITIWSSEFNQNSLSNFKSKYWNDFFEKVLDLWNKKETTTIWTVIENQDKLLSSNPSVYIPSDENIQQQIAQKNNKNISVKNV